MGEPRRLWKSWKPQENQKKYENHRIPQDNHKNNENYRISCKNLENQEKHKIL